MGLANRKTLERLVREAEVVVAAWGTTRLSPEAREIADWIGSLEKTRCLGFTKNGSPKHPLLLSKNTRLVPMQR